MSAQTTSIAEVAARSILAGDGLHFWIREGRQIFAIDEEGKKKAICLITEREDPEDFKANADLLLAAPDLLVALNFAYPIVADRAAGGRMITTRKQAQRALQLIADAIQKATEGKG